MKSDIIGSVVIVLALLFLGFVGYSFRDVLFGINYH